MKKSRNFAHSLFVIVKRDLVAYYRGVSWFFLLLVYFLTWLFFTATTLGNMVDIRNYFQFLTAGILVIGVYNASGSYTNVISGERRRGYTKYLISLPVNHIGLAIGRVCAGMLQGITFSVLALAATFVIVGAPSVMGVLILIITILCLAFGLSALGISFAVYFKPDLMDPISDITGIWLVFCSTVFFPEYLMPEPFNLLVRVNPMSAAANLLRVGLGMATLSWLDVIVLTIFTLLFAVASIAGYLHKMTAVD